MELDDTVLMQLSRRSSLTNPATWYVLAGFLLLGASVWVPWLTAERTARIESRADEIAGLLLDATNGFFDGVTPDDVPVVLARFYCLAARDGVLVGDLETVEPGLPGTLLTLRNKHYLFYLAQSVLEADAIASRQAHPAIETMAWPIDRLGPGHSAFFHPGDAPRAYTRNLTGSYIGLHDHPPAPSDPHRRTGTGPESARMYRDARDESWIVD